MDDQTTQVDMDTIPMDVNDFKDESEQVETQETTAEESSPEETKAPEVADQPQETEGQDSDDSQGTESPEDTAKDDQPQSKAEERKQQLNTEIRDLVSQRNAIKQEVEKLNSQVYQPESVEDLVEQGMSEQDARIAAMERKQEIADYNNKVVEAQLTLSSESQRVLQDFPLFDPESSDFKPQIAEQAASLLEANLVKDPNTGQVIGSNVSPYQLYKTIADAYQVSQQEGQIKGQKATEQMLASVDAPSSAAPAKKEEDKDPFLAGFDAV